MIESDGHPLRPDHLQLTQRPSPPSSTPSSPAIASTPAATPTEPPELPWNLEEAELVLIRRALQKTSGNMSAAATLLGVDRSKLYRRLSADPAQPESP